MQKPPPIHDESRRLAALKRYEILDTLPEETFDNVTLLASQICGTPIALISLIDEDRQWFKSRRGMDAAETSRDVSFCGHAIGSPERVFEVNDATADQRFADNPLVTGDTRVGFYAGAPLTTTDGDRVGTLCVIDHVPRELTEAQKAALSALSDQVVRLFEARRLQQETHAARKAERAALRRAEANQRELQLVFDVTHVGMALVREPDFKFEKVNAAFRALVGPREYAGLAWRDVYADSTDETMFDQLTTVYRAGGRVSDHERPLRVPTGAGAFEDRYYDVTYDRVDASDGDVHGILIQTVDVTDDVRRRAEHEEQARQLRAARDQATESRQRLEETLRAMPVGVAFFEGPEHRYSFVNDVHASYFGGREGFVGRTVAEMVPELSNTEIPGILERVFETGEPYFAEEHPVRFNQPDGSVRAMILKLAYQAVRDVAGEVNGIVATVVDVTDVVRAREELIGKNALIAETQRLLTAAIKVAKVGFFEWRIADDVIEFSEQMQIDWGILAGVPLDSVLNQIVAEDRDGVVVKIREAIETGQPYYAQYRVTPPGKGGHTWIEAHGEVTYDAHNQPLAFIGTSVDITSRKTVETEAQAIANSIPQMTWMTDATGYINWYNTRWYEYTGMTFEDMRGWGWQAVQHPEHLAAVTAKYVAHMASGEPWEDTFPLRGHDGTYRWFLSRAVPLRDEAGHVVRWFGSNTDVTRQREDERELTKLAAVIEGTTDFIGMFDPEFRPVYLNEAGRRLVGFGRDDIHSVRLADVIVPERRADMDRTIYPAVLRDGFWQGELEFRHFGTGATIPVWFNLFPVRDPDTGRPLAYATVTRDISERKAFEANLEDAKDAAERANGAKSAFLANMSHEIRSPLGAIMGFSDLIKNPEITADELANFVAIIDRNSHHLLRIVDDILDLSKVEAGKMLIEHLEFSLPDLLADFTSLMSFRARDKGIGFELQIPTTIPECVISDPTRLRQILTNVVGNAIKFTARGAVRMSVTFVEGELVFTVVDTGPGIERGQADQLFRAFQQADVSTTRKYGGTGLGLVLTRRLSEALGGEFNLVESRVGHGSTFRASIRIDRCANLKMVDATALEYAVSSSKIVEVSGQLAGLRILVVEDSPDNQMLFQLMLTKLGAAIKIARDGIEGVQMAMTNEFDAVLCDVQMPRMDGYEATRELRKRGYAVPIVALTAHAMKEERERALVSGFTDFLTKPIHKDSLVETILRVTAPS